MSTAMATMRSSRTNASLAQGEPSGSLPSACATSLRPAEFSWLDAPVASSGVDWPRSTWLYVVVDRAPPVLDAAGAATTNGSAVHSMRTAAATDGEHPARLQRRRAGATGLRRDVDGALHVRMDEADVLVASGLGERQRVREQRRREGQHKP